MNLPSIDFFELIIFDLDGVLINSTPCHAQAFADLWEKIGIEGPRYEQIAGRKTIDAVASVTAPLHPSEQQIREWVEFKQRRALEYLSELPIVYEDSIPALDSLAGSGKVLALGTSASGRSTRLAMEKLNGEKYFSLVVTGDDVENGKPDPEIYNRIMKSLEVNPGKTLIIEDSASGIQAALAANASVVSVRSGMMVHHPNFWGSFENLLSLITALGLPAVKRASGS